MFRNTEMFMFNLVTESSLGKLKTFLVIVLLLLLLLLLLFLVVVVAILFGCWSSCVTYYEADTNPIQLTQINLYIGLSRIML